MVGSPSRPSNQNSNSIKPQTIVGRPALLNVLLEEQSARDAELAIAENLIRSFERTDGAFNPQLTTDTITPTAGNFVAVYRVADLASTLQSYDSVEDNIQIVIDKFFYTLNVESTKPFMFFPFLIYMENGEAITTTYGTNKNPSTAIRTALGSFVYSLKLAKPKLGKHYKENGTDIYQCKLQFGITKEVRKYMKRYYKFLEQEISAPALELGYFYYTEVATTPVTITRFSLERHHSIENRRISF